VPQAPAGRLRKPQNAGLPAKFLSKNEVPWHKFFAKKKENQKKYKKRTKFV